MRRVVVTGLGLVAPTGNNVKESWDVLLAGRSCVGPITQFDTTNFPTKIAAEVKNFDASSLMDAKEIRRTPRFIQLALAAAHEALQMSGLDSEKYGDHIGCSVGVGMGGMLLTEENCQALNSGGPKRVTPFYIPYTIANMAAGMVSMKYHLRGPNICPTTACASGTHGIGEAFNLIAKGSCNAAVAGGAESVVSPLAVAGFNSMKALSTENESPETASKPFDKNRTGFVMGEGAGILVLEELEFARKRGATIYAEVVGFGLSGDAYHLTAPAPGGEGAARCMAATLKDAKLNPEQITYINAHGTSTKMNDAYESAAIGTVFGNHAKKLAISSTKGATGHCLGAAGGVEAVFSVQSIYYGVVPPTINYTTPDPECPWDYIPNEARELSVPFALSNSFGFGGTNASLAFAKFKG